MVLKIFKNLIALALTTGIIILGYHCAEITCSPAKPDMSTKDTIKWFIYFLGMYIIVIRPVCNYWGDKMYYLFNPKKN